MRGMEGIDRDRTVAVVGTGTMGQGIAQVALVAGHPVVLYDAGPGRASEAAAGIARRLDRLFAKGRLTEDGRDAARGRLTAAGSLDGLAGAALVIEAVVEDLAAKRALFTGLEPVVADDCLLATNTSSLPVTAIAAPLRLPGRLLGLHFFNPAPLLPLVEVVSGAATDPVAGALARATVTAWGKTPVSCADTPGFIVNRVARPFYAEAFRLYEERAADPATVDAVLRESGGFAMGPFELTDLIGQDVNEAVTRSVWTAFHFDPKFAPSAAQRRLVDAGRLGRKSGHGWYIHRTDPAPDAGRTGQNPEQAGGNAGGGNADVGQAGGASTGTGNAAGAVGNPGPGNSATGNTDAGTGGGEPEAGGRRSGGRRDGGGALPHTAPPAKPPESVTVHGSLGPASALVGMVEAAGIAVLTTGTPPEPRRREEQRRPQGGGWIELPDGTVLALTDGRPATREAGGVPRILFDLALDYGSAARIALAPSDTAPPQSLETATGLFQALGKRVSVIDDVPGMIVARTVAMLVDFAADAVARGVASAADTDTAMRLGVNYPLGPLEWGDRLGPWWVAAVLGALHGERPDGRYAPSAGLRRRAVAGGSLREG